MELLTRKNSLVTKIFLELLAWPNNLILYDEGFFYKVYYMISRDNITS